MTTDLLGVSFCVKMLIPAVFEFFIYKIVGNIIILVCWSTYEQISFVKQFSQYGLRLTFVCDPKFLVGNPNHNFQGVIYIMQEHDDVLEKVNRSYFSHWYKWLVIGESIPDAFSKVRYDADITFLREEKAAVMNLQEMNGTSSSAESYYVFENVYIHPEKGASKHEWGYWNKNGLQVTQDWRRIKRLRSLDKYPFRIAAPVAHFNGDSYKGSFAEYLLDQTVPDAGLRCGYAASALLIEAANATEVLLPVQYWVSNTEKNGTILTLGTGSADLSAGVLRVLKQRLEHLDYVMPIWLFSVGFTYLAERESSSNMYVEPFTAALWWTCLLVGLILAVAQRVASRKLEEKDGAFFTVLATWMQQDASAVPEGITGRWTFTVLSGCSMLVHAYYTSAIVSALMSTGRGGPKTLRALADSRYAIASEDHDFIRHSMFNVETNWPDLEYLKSKKMTSKFYQDIQNGVELVQQGTTAYHAEYHQIYQYLDNFSDNELCKIQHVDTIPEAMTWVSSTARGQYTEIFRSAGAWLYETGLARRLISRLQLHPPPCRVSLLAERVNFWDVAPLLGLTTLGAITSMGMLGLEILFAKYIGPHTRNVWTKSISEADSTSTIVI